MGVVELNRLNDAYRAEGHFREALKICREQGDNEDVVDPIMDIGLCRRHLGDLDSALALFEEALALSRDGGLEVLEARALGEIGNTRWLRGEYQLALQDVGVSNRIAERTGEHFQLNVNYQLLGLIYWELNQFDRAHAALDRAVEEARLAERPLEIASAYNNRGIVYRRQKLYGRALEFFGRALELDERLRSRWGQGYDHRNMGITYHRTGEFERAGEHLERAVALCEQIDDRANLARSQFDLGDLRISQRRLDEAEVLLRMALEGARQVYMPELEWRVLRGIGRLHRLRGEREQALDWFKLAVEVVEKMGATIKAEEFRDGFLSNKMDLYEDIVELLLEMGQAEEALSYAERSRSRSFIDILANRSFSLKTEEEKELYDRQGEMKREMHALSVALRREKRVEQREMLAGQLNELQRRYSDLLIDIRNLNPQLSSFVTVEVAPLAEVSEALGPETTLLVYYLMEEKLAIWAIAGGELHVRVVEVGREELSRRIREYRLTIQNRELLQEVTARGRKLYDDLIRPVEQFVRRARVVGIVPHRSLHYLSFASLHDGESYLAEEVPLFYSPSASLLPYSLSGPGPQKKDSLKVLAVGNPRLGDRAYELPFTEKEVLSIKRDFDGVTAFLQQEATEQQVVENMGLFDVVHIGAHGRFDTVNPLFSALMLAPTEGYDGDLQLHEVTGLKINARLVVLSACQSGLGKLTSADELVGLSRAFAYAGTRAILSTLWRVDDVSTALLTKHFYRSYVDHGAGESLRHAQLQVMNDERHSHPTYWAGMVLSGDYR